jgi:hypothetical protein
MPTPKIGTDSTLFTRISNHRISPREAPAASANSSARALTALHNGQMPRAAGQAASGMNASIRQFIDKVRLDEAGLKYASPAFAVSCVKLPTQTGAAASVTQTQDNAVDCLLKASTITALHPIAFFSAADSQHIGGAMDERVEFKHSKLLQEETGCALVRGSIAALNGAAASYPLGQQTPMQHQLYARGLTFRHAPAIREALSQVAGSGDARIQAQLDILLKSSFCPSNTQGPRVDMISISGVDRRGLAQLDAVGLYEGTLRQLSHALVTAKQQGIKTVVMTLPGSGIFARFSRAPQAEQDPQYLDIIACAAADAVTYFGSGLTILVPTHGTRLDFSFSQYRDVSLLGLVPQGLDYRLGLQLASPGDAKLQAALLRLTGTASVPVSSTHQVPDLGTVAPSSGALPAEQLEPRKLGDVAYHVERTNQATLPDSPVSNVLERLIGAGKGMTLRLAHGVDDNTPINAPVCTVLKRDPDPTVGKALLSVRVGANERVVCEAVYSRNVQPAFAKYVSAASVR